MKSYIIDIFQRYAATPAMRRLEGSASTTD